MLPGATLICAATVAPIVSAAVLTSAPTAAESVIVTGDETTFVFTRNTALSVPSTTRQLAGTEADRASLVARRTRMPPEGARPLRRTVPWHSWPPSNLLAPSVSETRVGLADALLPTVRKALFVVPSREAEIWTSTEPVTGLVWHRKGADSDPCGTITLPTTETIPGLLLERDTATPPAGAAAVRLTVPPQTLPPITALVFRLIRARAEPLGGGLEPVLPTPTVRKALFVVPPREAEICTPRELVRSEER